MHYNFIHDIHMDVFYIVLNCVLSAKNCIFRRASLIIQQISTYLIIILDKSLKKFAEITIFAFTCLKLTFYALNERKRLNL